MNLTDPEILELNELCGAVVDGGLTDAQRVRLVELLRDSEAARQFYVRAMGQSASLYGYAGEVHGEMPDRLGAARGGSRAAWWGYGAVAAAAAMVGAFWWVGVSAAREESVAVRPVSQFVARVAGAKAAQWTRNSAALLPGAQLRRGDQIALAAGCVEITFDSGARLVLEGAAVLDINSAWSATLRRGILTVSVPPEAVGFRVSNPAVEIVDLGTEFTMIADGAGGADVLVLKGEVEAAPRMAGEQETILLREKESRRFASSGVTEVADREQKFARFAQPRSLDRFIAPEAHIHWSFDEAAGAVMAAETVGIALAAGEAQMTMFDATDPAAAHPASPRGRSLRLDARLYAKGRFPGLSGAGAHTVAFWIKVPEEAPLSEAYTMVAWATEVAKLSFRPVQISWNRRREEGALGALRTDFGGGAAIGTTPLRDGRWHHVAVYFSAGDDPVAPVQVKQYVDGRLESSTIIPGRTRATGSVDPALTDVVWIGRRLTGGQKYPERFRGEIDELFIAARGLAPAEIVSLMKHNQLPAPGLATHP